MIGAQAKMEEVAMDGEKQPDSDTPKRQNWQDLIIIIVLVVTAV